MLSDLYNHEVSFEKDMKLIAESVIEDPIENPEDDEVDVEAVPQSAIDKANEFLDKMVSRDDYDDTDLDDLMDDDDDDDLDDEENIIITEASNGLDEVIDTLNESEVNELITLGDMKGMLHESAEVMDQTTFLESVGSELESYWLAEAASWEQDTEALNELHTGAIQSIKHIIDGHNKEGKSFLADAKRSYNKGDYKQATKEIDLAIKSLKAARKEAENIDDNGILETIGFSMLATATGIGAIAYTVGYFYSWYNLRKQADKGDVYSNTKSTRGKNLVLEWLFGPIRHAGWSRASILAGYDKLIGECELIKKKIAAQKND